MKLDRNHSNIFRCPSTGLQLLNHERMYSHGVCPRCGHDNGSTITHFKIEVGKWSDPSIFERLFKGVKPQWIPKDKNDQ